MTSLARRGGRLRRSARVKLQLCAIFAVASVLSWSMAPPADAKVNPLVVIQRQIHKANMLVVLDTSGSMTGVPGGIFYYKAEAGVDCDDGYNCRQAGLMGNCTVSGKSCYSDEDCQRHYCELTPTKFCNTNADCMPSDHICSVTGEACSATVPCPPNKGKCATTKEVCSNTADCPGTCSNCTTVPCSPIGSACPKPIGTCDEDPTKVCTSDFVCPQKASGNCAQGGTPPSGCSDHADCPTKQKCANTDETCRATTECPGQKKGRCSLSGEVCNNNNQCESEETCVYWTNPCVGPPNPCDKSYTSCTLCTDTASNPNMCVHTHNTCVIAPNDCVPVESNPCVTPTIGDVCGPSTAPKKESGSPGPIRMCRASQTVCGSNKDCASGDTCGPATSRMVIAKRAISTVMNSSYEMVNFGLMTFYQGGYYPYYEIVGGTTGTVTEFVTKDRLLQVTPECWTPSWGPSGTCTLSGMSMKLRLMQNSRYVVNTGTTFIEVEDNFCGDTCDIKGLGTGIYVGSFYQYDGVQGGNATSSQVLATYEGKTTPIAGKDYVYYEARPDYYNGGMPPPFTFTDCETTGVCGAHCGGRWDTSLAPFIDTSDDPVVAKANVEKINERMAKASNGGLLAYWSTPIGCTLENDSAAASPNNSAYHYMSTLKAGDSVACRENFILLITDGAANGPGDIDASGKSLCDVAACGEADPEAAGCLCRSVLATYHLRKNLGVKTFVIGFSGDAAAAIPRAINENMARAGGTDAGGSGAPYAFLAQSESELVNAIQMAVFDAVRGSYSTAPTSTSAGTQQATTVAEGRYALDSRMDFPEWKGHLIAYDLGGTTPTIAWDAYTQLAAMNWKTRRVYTWDGTNMVKIQVDSSGAVINKAALAALGLGADATEAEKVARWALGDPTYKNPALLGAIINSTPIDIAGPGDIPLPGGHDFYLAHRDRPHLVYVGSSDGMLHAFFLEATTIGSSTYPAGSEAFAFIPPEMLPVIKRLYAQGGQKTDPYHHIFGLADSPKAKSICVSGCSDPATAVWKTLLIMPEGYGGSETFVLDVTSPFSSTGVADPPVTVRWHTAQGSSASDYEDYLGNTISLPAFFMNKTAALDDNRVVFASGYAIDPSKTNQGRTLITASAASGVIKDHFVLDPTQSALDSTPAAVDPNAPNNNDCGIPYAALTDVATARDFGRNQDNRMLAAYFGDTYGRLWRYTLGGTLDRPAYNFGCGHPLHFAPTIVQLDRDDFNSSHAREIYPVIVTNSNLDLDTDNRVPSQMIFLKEIAQVDKDGVFSGVSQDMTWGSNTGRVTLTVGNDSEICGVTSKDPITEVVSCTASMPLTARPTSTPLGLLRSDASGFQVMTMWYVPAADGCTKGTTYLTIHEMVANSVGQLLGAAVAQEPVTSPVVLRGHIYLFGSGGAYDITNLASDTVVTAGRAIEPSSVGGNFTRFNWTEVFE